MAETIQTIQPNSVGLQASSFRKLTVMVACTVLLLFGAGLTYGLGVMYAELVTVFGAPRSQTALIQSLYSGLTAGAGILFTRLIREYGPGPIAMIGGVIASVFLSVNYFAANVSTIIVCSGVITGLGMGVCYLGSFISVTLLFHDNAGLPLIILSIGQSVGQFIIPVLTEMFIAEYQWNGAYLLIGALTLNVLPCGLILYTSRAYYKDDTKSNKNVKIFDMRLLKDPILVIMIFNIFLVGLTGNTEPWFIVDIMTSRGQPRDQGSLLVSMVGLGNCLGRAVGAALRVGCKIPTAVHWIYISLVLATGHALVINVTDFSLLVASCILYGIGFGTTLSQVATVIFDSTGPDKFLQGMAMANLLFGFGNFTGGLLGGYIRDSSGQYNIMFYFAIAGSLYICLSTLLVTWLLKRRHRPDEETVKLIQHDSIAYDTIDK